MTTEMSTGWRADSAGCCSGSPQHPGVRRPGRRGSAWCAVGSLVPLLALACTDDVPAEDPPGDEAPVETDPLPAPPTEPPDAHGPYEAGVTTLELERGELPPLTVEVWYPSAPEAGDTPDPYALGDLDFPGAAFRDAPPDPRGGSFPVVAFSHGFGGVRFQSAFLTEHLARHGFVVVAPDHAGSSLLDFRPDEVAATAVFRPTDVADAVDALADPGVPDLRVDAGTYAVVGHSFGAWTALVVGGGRLDVAAFATVCATEDRTTCGFFEGQSLDPEEAARWAVPDPRAVVTAALAPGGWYAFGSDGGGLADVRLPLVLGGTRDGDMPYDSEILPTFEHLGTPRWLGTFEGAGHWSFTDLCALFPVADCAGASDGYLEPAVVQDLTRARVLAHVRVHLLGYTEDAATLTGAEHLAWVADE